MKILNKFYIFFHDDIIPYFKASNKKPFLTQITEIAGLYKKYQYLPYQYVRSRLYSVYAPHNILNFMPPKLIDDLQHRLNDNRYFKYAYDKHVFRVFLENKGLPVIRELLRILPSGVIQDSNQQEITRPVAAKILTMHGENVFVKPTTGAFGDGAFIHDISTSMDRLFSNDGDILIQPIVLQHDVLKDLHPSSLNTIRIDTLLDDGQCFNNAAVLRIGYGGSVIDNFCAGSLFVGIDMKTGRLFPEAIQQSRFVRNKYEHHPDTGIAFASVIIPFWKDVIELTHAAAYSLPQLRTLGWDVAITPKGPLLVETNKNWGVDLMQDGWGGMGATHIGQLAVKLRRMNR